MTEIEAVAIRQIARGYQARASKIESYLASLSAIGSYYERQKLGLSNQELAAFREEARKFIMAAMGTGVLAEVFCEQLERDIGPTHGATIPERFRRFREKVAAMADASEGGGR